MCGIGGFFAQRTVDPQVVTAMQDALSARGPDAQHAQLWGREGLLHARLSIIASSSSARASTRRSSSTGAPASTY